MINFYEQAFAANTSPLLSSTTDPWDIVLFVVRFVNDLVLMKRR